MRIGRLVVIGLCLLSIGFVGCSQQSAPPKAKSEAKTEPKVDAKPPEDITDPQAFARRTGQMFDVIKLALETDSSRIVSLFVDNIGSGRAMVKR